MINLYALYEPAILPLKIVCQEVNLISIRPISLEVVLGYLPEPFVPMIQLNLLKGPITCFPRHDLKFSTSNCFKYPISKKAGEEDNTITPLA